MIESHSANVLELDKGRGGLLDKSSLLLGHSTAPYRVCLSASYVSPSPPLLHIFCGPFPPPPPPPLGAANVENVSPPPPLPREINCASVIYEAHLNKEQHTTLVAETLTEEKLELFHNSCF